MATTSGSCCISPLYEMTRPPRRYVSSLMLLPIMTARRSALQNDLVKVLLRFPKEPVVLTADITEMFLQVVLAEQDRRYHRFVWDSRVYEFKRLVFGIKASPYLACKALQVVCREPADEYDPAMLQIVDRDMYVDC